MSRTPRADVPAISSVWLDTYGPETRSRTSISEPEGSTKR